MSPKLVLDKDSLPSRIKIPRPSRPHEWIEYGNTDENEITQRVQYAEIVITNKVPITSDVLANSPNLKHIAVTATGFNIIDTQACKVNGVSVSNVPSYAATTVSEHVIASSLLLQRQVKHYAELVRQGAWQKTSTFCVFGKPFHNLSGATIGLVGMGEIGKATAKKANALGMKVVFCARKKINTDQIPYATQVEFSDLLKDSDIVSIHCDLNPTSQGLIGAEQIKLMKHHAILINTARGGIVDEFAVVRAIRNQRLGGLAFDVFETEPPKSNAPLLSIASLPNVLITPHIAWASEEAMQHLGDTTSNNISSFLNGTPDNLVT